MISNKQNPKEAFVWIWLPGNTEPVVAGKLTSLQNSIVFNYGKSYLKRSNAIPLNPNELPLHSGILPLLNGLTMPGCIRDASPDAWGRRVILNKKTNLRNNSNNIVDLNEITYLLESGSDRIGALDFQLSSSEYIPREPNNATLEELLASAERVERGLPLSKELDQALFHGSSIGGARPKALIMHKDKKYIAKFVSSADLYNIIKAEFIAMKLAQLCDIETAKVHLTKASHKDVLLIQRFDRVRQQDSWCRKSILSALTLLGLDEMMARYASYQELAEIIRVKFLNPKATLKELFKRLCFNILIGNTDDHARNHAAFWDGNILQLTPAYDICPQGRTGNEATQAMLILDNNRYSQINVCINAAHHYLLSRENALEIVLQQVDSIKKNWNNVCDSAELSETDSNALWQRQVLNPFVFENLDSDLHKHLGILSNQG